MKDSFERNKYGVPIKKCCASCAHKQLDNRNRICMAGEGDVPPSYLCPLWEMSQSFEKAGKGDGKVKKYDYLQFVLDRLVMDDTYARAASEKGLSYKRSGIHEIRYLYNKAYGTIFDIED